MLFGFLTILIIINAKINVKLRTSTYPTYRNPVNPSCKNVQINDIENRNNSNNDNDSNNYNNDNDNDNSNNLNNSISRKGTSKYVTDPDYNKFYWGNN
tara:strand:+ start:183 stop:476 length:294 start_codon:yes stop_codon:yes gene_type:complete